MKLEAVEEPGSPIVVEGGGIGPSVMESIKGENKDMEEAIRMAKVII